MLEQLILLALFAALLYAYLQGKKQGRTTQQVEGLKKHAESVSKGLKAKRDFDTDAAERERVQDRYTE